MHVSQAEWDAESLPLVLNARNMLIQFLMEDKQGSLSHHLQQLAKGTSFTHRWCDGSGQLGANFNP